jgi:hypothetical protein
MQVDKKLKQKLIEELPDFYDSVPVYPIRDLSSDEINEKATYCASQFMGRGSLATFRSTEKNDDMTLVNLPWNTRMWIYRNSNAIIIERRLNPFQNLFELGSDINKLGRIAIDIMKRLKLDKWKYPFEQLEFESLGQVKVTGINIEGEKSQILSTRIIGNFRRYINEVPVYGRASVSIRIAGRYTVESIRIDWRHIEEKPIEYPKIIDSESAADKILSKFNSAFPNSKLSSEDWSPRFFGLGYFSMPKTRHQKYIQPVYIAMFKPSDTALTTLNPVIIIPATTRNYESIETPV